MRVECTMLDAYGYPISCDQPDPCGPTGLVTLYHLTDCTAQSEPFAVFCAGHPGHPACTIVPPSPGPVHDLPHTGGAGGVRDASPEQDPA